MINSLLVILILFVGGIAGLALVGHLSVELKRCYYFGIHVWSRWLPVAAAAVYLLLLAGSLTQQPLLGLADFELAPVLSIYEQAILFLMGPLLLTRFGNICASVILIYAIEQAIFSKVPDSASLGFIALIGSVTAVAILGDKMPWHGNHQLQEVAGRLREILVVVFSVFIIAIVFFTILDLHTFARWLDRHLAFSVNKGVIFGVLALMFVGWLSIAMGFTRHLAIPLLSLPSIFVIAFMTDWSTNLLAIPFTVSLALALATADRRSTDRRRRSSMHISQRRFAYR